MHGGRENALGRNSLCGGPMVHTCSSTLWDWKYDRGRWVHTVKAVRKAPLRRGQNPFSESYSDIRWRSQRHEGPLHSGSWMNMIIHHTSYHRGHLALGFPNREGSVPAPPLTVCNDGSQYVEIQTPSLPPTHGCPYLPSAEIAETNTRVSNHTTKSQILIVLPW